MYHGPTMISIIQVNLRKMGTARCMLNQAASETQADILIISEQPKGPPDDEWSLSGLDAPAQLVITNSASAVARDVVRGRYHVGAVVHGIAVFSCYLPPSLTTAQFREALDELRDDCGRFPRSDLLVVGDFNAKVALWGSILTDPKGDSLKEFAATLNLCIEDIGDAPTFQAGPRSSVIDFTLSRLADPRRLTG